MPFQPFSAAVSLVSVASRAPTAHKASQHGFSSNSQEVSLVKEMHCTVCIDDKQVNLGFQGGVIVSLVIFQSAALVRCIVVHIG